jgi:hypothetical protein
MQFSFVLQVLVCVMSDNFSFHNNTTIAKSCKLHDYMYTYVHVAKIVYTYMYMYMYVC